MAVQYPIAMPAMPPGPKQIQLIQNFIVAKTPSPFTAQQQMYEHQGSWWTGKVDMPYLTRAQAAPWMAFFALLNGKSGTFLFGDPTITGPLSSPGNPYVNGAGQSGKTLLVASLSAPGFKAGDYFQIGGENRIVWSQAFENAAWNYINATRPTADTIVDPNGGTTAEAIVSTSSLPQVFQNLPLPCFTPGQKYTFSVWLKAPAGALNVTLLLSTGGNANFGSSVVSLTTSWQRFSVTGIAGDSTVPQAGIFTWTSGVTIHAWGAQLQMGPASVIGTTSSDYYPTTSAQQPSIQRLHMVLGDIGPDPSTNGLLDIFPRLRESPIYSNTGNRLKFANPQGLFRLDSNVQPVTVDKDGHYSISFGLEEAF